MKNRPFPDILIRRYQNWRTFKAIKRAEIRAVLRDTDDMQCASAYLPQRAYELTSRVREDLYELSRLLSEKEWGR